MRDFSRPALLIALLLLFVFLTNGGGFLFGFGLAGGVKWLLIGIAIYLCFNCCSGGGCWGEWCESEDDSEADTEEEGTDD